MDRTSADNDGISRGTQQAHDEAVHWVRTTDGRPASMSLNLVADDPVKSGNKISNDKGALNGWCTKLQIAIV
jgi:hypothetical protein